MPSEVLEPPPGAPAPPPGAFQPGIWTKEIDVRDFIQENYTPYYGDESFLAGPTERTLPIWARLQALFVEERKKGVLDVSQIPSSITAHAPGYIDKEREVIVGLQTAWRALQRPGRRQRPGVHSVFGQPRPLSAASGAQLAHIVAVALSGFLRGRLG